MFPAEYAEKESKKCKFILVLMTGEIFKKDRFHELLRDQREIL